MPIKFYSVTAAAEALGVSRWQIRRYILAGELDAINVGFGTRECRRIPIESLEAFIARRRVAA